MRQLSFCLLPFKMEGYPLDLAGCERSIFIDIYHIIGGVNMEYIILQSRYYKYREDEDLAFICSLYP